MSKAQLKSKTSGKSSGGGSHSNGEVTPQQVLEVALPKALKASEKQARAIGATFVINLGGDDGGEWVVDLKKLEVRRGTLEKPDVLLEMMDTDFAAMTKGKLDVANAAREGRIRISGNPELLISLGQLISG